MKTLILQCGIRQVKGGFEAIFPATGTDDPFAGEQGGGKPIVIKAQTKAKALTGLRRAISTAIKKHPSPTIQAAYAHDQLALEPGECHPGPPVSPMTHPPGKRISPPKGKSLAQKTAYLKSLKRFFTDTDHPLFRLNWDFRPCADQEIPACAFYEFARESQSMINLARSFKTTLGVSKNGHSHESNIMLCMAKDRLRVIADCLEFFPEVPWLSIPAKLRATAAAKIHAADLKTSIQQKLNPPFKLLRYQEADRGLIAINETGLIPGPLVCGTIQINLDANDQTIKRGFSAWLAKARKAHRNQNPSHTDHRGRDNTRDLLTALGAVRLMRVVELSVEDCAELIPQYFRISFYHHRQDWSEAKDRVQKITSRFR